MLESAVSKYKQQQVVTVKRQKARATSNRVSSVNKADRDAEIFRLRLSGLSTDMIARQLGESASLINAVIRTEIKRINSECTEAAQEVQSMELIRLDQMMQVHMTHALAGDIEASMMVLRIMERRAKYLGIDAAGKLEIKGEAIKQYVGIDMSRM